MPGIVPTCGFRLTDVWISVYQGGLYLREEGFDPTPQGSTACNASYNTYMCVPIRDLKFIPLLHQVVMKYYVPVLQDG